MLLGTALISPDITRLDTTNSRPQLVSLAQLFGRIERRCPFSRHYPAAIILCGGTSSVFNATNFDVSNCKFWTWCRVEGLANRQRGFKLLQLTQPSGIRRLQPSVASPTHMACPRAKVGSAGRYFRKSSVQTRMSVHSEYRGIRPLNTRCNKFTLPYLGTASTQPRLNHD